MAVMTHDSDQRVQTRILAVLTALFGVVMATARRVAEPHTASISNLKAMPLTVGGVFCIDFAGFHLPHGWGWLITGLSLIILESVIADDSGLGAK